jgi:hypothetical protein
VISSRFTNDVTHVLTARAASMQVDIRNTKARSTTTVSDSIDEVIVRMSAVIRLLSTNVRSERDRIGSLVNGEAVEVDGPVQ